MLHNRLFTAPNYVQTLNTERSDNLLLIPRGNVTFRFDWIALMCLSDYETTPTDSSLDYAIKLQQTLQHFDSLLSHFTHQKYPSFLKLSALSKEIMETTKMSYTICDIRRPQSDCDILTSLQATVIIIRIQR